VKLLLDCHITKATLGALRDIAPGIRAELLSDWRRGAFRRADDAEVLMACYEERRAFLTYDLTTVPDLLRRWASEERPHSGVLFADTMAIPPNMPARVAAAVAKLAEEIGDADLENVVLFLRGARA
jgi:hypothetical protein